MYTRWILIGIEVILKFSPLSFSIRFLDAEEYRISSDPEIRREFASPFSFNTLRRQLAGE